MPPLIQGQPTTLRAAVLALLSTALQGTEIPAQLHATMLHFLMRRSDADLHAMASQLCEAADTLRPFLHEDNRP